MMNRLLGQVFISIDRIRTKGLSANTASHTCLTHIPASFAIKQAVSCVLKPKRECYDPDQKSSIVLLHPLVQAGSWLLNVPQSIFDARRKELFLS